MKNLGYTDSLRFFASAVLRLRMTFPLGFKPTDYYTRCAALTARHSATAPSPLDLSPS